MWLYRMTHCVFLLIAAVLAIAVVVSPTTEGWRPFAWYGYPGKEPGTVGYQARGDWCGVVPATRKPGEPLPIVPPEKCGSGSC